MKVSCIMPCNRPEDLPHAIEVFLSQDYEDKELIIYGCQYHDIPGFDFMMGSECSPAICITAPVRWLKELYSHSSIGKARNICCDLARGDIILHMDSDDHYASDWVTRSADCLLGAGADCIGLRAAYFYQHNTKLWLYQYTGRQPYAIGATLCYRKELWKRNPFLDITMGEDTAFVANAGVIINHDYINGFCAIIHDKNTCSHMALSAMQEQPIEHVRHINGLILPI